MSEKFRQATVAIIVNNENKILIGLSPRDGAYKFPQWWLDKWELPLNWIKREVEEELWEKIKDTDVIWEYGKVKYYYPWGMDVKYPNSNRIGQEMVVFMVKFREDMKLIPQDDEFEELIWINPKEVDDYHCKHRKEAYIQALKNYDLL